MAEAMAEPQVLTLLELEKARLENALAHLRQSNAQLAEALQTGPDADFEQAIKENVVVIKEMEEKVARLQDEVEELKLRS
eukprot:SM000316S12300  [mRNA]  locus=s316:105669:106122:- [translate_table: standard]